MVNLPPRKMRGIVSEDMLFDIGYADSITPVLATPESPVPNGARAQALSQAVIFIPYYLHTNPVGVARAQQMLREVLADTP